MQSITVYPDVTKVANFWRKNADVSRTQMMFHVIYIFSDLP